MATRRYLCRKHTTAKSIELLVDIVVTTRDTAIHRTLSVMYLEFSRKSGVLADGKRHPDPRSSPGTSWCRAVETRAQSISVGGKFCLCLLVRRVCGLLTQQQLQQRMFYPRDDSGRGGGVQAQFLCSIWLSSLLRCYQSNSVFWRRGAQSWTGIRYLACCVPGRTGWLNPVSSTRTLGRVRCTDKRRLGLADLVYSE